MTNTWGDCPELSEIDNLSNNNPVQVDQNQDTDCEDQNTQGPSISNTPSINPNVQAATDPTNCSLENLPAGGTTDSYKCVNGNWTPANSAAAQDINTRARFCESYYGGDPDEKKQCLEDAAIEALIEQGGGAGDLAKGNPEMWLKLGISLSYVTSALSKTTCKAPSAMALTAAALAASVGDVLGWYKDYRNSRRLAEVYEEYNEDTSTEDAQRMAFNYIATQQEYRYESFKRKSITIDISKIIYTLATGLAAIEVFSKSSIPCVEKDDVKTKSKVGNKAIKTLLFSPLSKIIYFASGALPFVFKVNSSDSVEQYQAPTKSILDKAKETSFWKTVDIIDRLGQLIIPYSHADVVSSTSAMLEEIPKIDYTQFIQKTVNENAINSAKEALEQSRIAAEAAAKKAAETAAKEAAAKKAQKRAVTRLILGTTAGTFSWVLAGHYAKVERKLKSRATIARRTADIFEEGVNLCDDEKNNDPSNLGCYCYQQGMTGERTPRMDRKSDQRCAVEWTFSEPNHDPTKYGGPAISNGKQACIAQTGQLDPNCSCRKQVNSKGVNACKKLPSQFEFGGDGVFTMTPFTREFNRDVNSMMAGKTSPSDFTSASLAANYNRAKTFRDNAIKKLNQKRKKAGKKPITLAKISGKLGKKLLSLSKNNRLPATGQLAATTNFKSQGPSLSPKLQKQVDSAIAKLNKSDVYKKAKYSKKRGSADDFDFSLGSNAQSGNKVMNVMGKQYDYEDNDVVKKPHESLFKILSYRYTVSGLRRLFPDEKLTSP
jgi:hypothetical protein